MTQFQRAKTLVYWALMLAASLFLAVLLAEASVRLISPQQEAMNWFESNDRYGFVMKKNFYQRYHYLSSSATMEVRTNSMGLRDKQRDLKIKKGKRILLLGDSFTFGYGLNMEDNFASKLEELLNQAEKHWAVINAGHGGWGTLQESLYAQDHFALFQPDFIILTFCGNDPSDDIAFLNKLHDSERGIIYFPGKLFLRNHSHLYRFLFNAFGVIVHNWALRIKANRVGGNLANIDDQSASIITQEDWGKTLEYIKELAAAFRNFNPVGMLLIQATAPLNNDIRMHLKPLSGQGNIHYVDLYDEVIKLEPHEMRLPHDGHWSPLMHSISAKELFRAIQRLSAGSRATLS